MPVQALRSCFNTGQPPMMQPWQIYLRGMAMGAADIVPGISGGTIAFITGIYARLIQCLRSFDWRLWAIFRQGGFVAVLRAVDATFLASLLAGILSSILLLTNLISWLLLTYPVPLYGFFFGLVSGSAIIVYREVTRWRLNLLACMVLGAFLAYALGAWLPNIEQPTALTFFIAGAIAICAMILPGISGSFLLLVMGLYAPLIDAVKSLHLLYVGSFALGAGSGILMFSHVLGWLFEHYRAATFATLFGFIVASLPHIWPWKTVSMTGHPLDAQMVTPWHYSVLSGQAHQLWLVILLAVAGWFLVLYLAKQQPKSA